MPINWHATVTNNVAIMWPCYWVYITVCMSCFCTLSASAFMHSTIPTWARFPLRNIFLWRLSCFCSLLIIIVICGTAHVIAVDASSTHVCIDKWCPTAYMPCPLSLWRKISQESGCSYVQNEAQKDNPQRISVVHILDANSTRNTLNMVDSAGHQLSTYMHIVLNYLQFIRITSNHQETQHSSATIKWCILVSPDLSSVAKRRAPPDYTRNDYCIASRALPTEA